MHIVGNAESRCRMKVRGPHILVVQLVFLAKFANIQKIMCVHFDSTTWLELLHWQSHNIYICEGASNASFIPIQYCKRYPCELLYAPVMLWLHSDC